MKKRNLWTSLYEPFVKTTMFRRNAFKKSVILREVKEQIIKIKTLTITLSARLIPR